LDIDRYAAPSGKNHHSENFPVVSWLVDPAYRSAVLVFYQFARTLDDIADHPTLATDEKISRLEGYRTAFLGRDDDDYAAAVACRRMMQEREISLQHGLDLLKAFFIDVHQKRCASWSALRVYCQYSAAPVGRFMLDLHREDQWLWPLADGLSQALQILNHLQDMGDDYHQLNRIYLPQDWMDQAGVQEKMLVAPCLSNPLRGVVDRMLTGVEGLLDSSRTLGYNIRNRRLAADVLVIDRLAWMMVRQLRTGDPLIHRLKPNKRAFFQAGVTGLYRYVAHIFR
jgi:squalene synthase HpnC